MTKVATVYHSAFGHTKRQAEAVAKGAGSLQGTEALLISVENIDSYWANLESADAIVFGCPTYMGTVSAQFKIFMDRTSSIWAKMIWKNKIASGFTNSGAIGGDKLNTLVQFLLFASQHGMIWVGLDIPAGNCSSTGHPGEMNRLGSWIGATAQSNVDQSAEFGPSQSDLLTAEYLGRRVSWAARRWRTLEFPQVSQLEVALEQQTI